MDSSSSPPSPAGGPSGPEAFFLPESCHARDGAQLLEELRVDRKTGLSSEEARRRLESCGPNALPVAQQRSAWVRFVRQFHNVLIYMLLAAGVITLLLGHYVDSGMIFAVVLINAVIGFIQEGKAEQALDAICSMLSLRAQVTRDGRRQELPAEELVPGDLVHVVSGDKLPADLRLIDMRSLRVEEAALTGESVPVEKSATAVAAEAVLGERSSMAYSGTLVAYGQATGVVVATGLQTEIGRISRMLGEVEELSTPLVRQIEAFGRWLTGLILAVAALSFAFGTLVRDYSAGEMFLAAVSLAVAVIPEGLPAIMTITLAIGVQRMARRNAIIRRLPLVEALGSVTVICSDKTGTLTRNEMTVQRVVCADAAYAVSGVGYAPQGAFERLGGAGSAAVQPGDDPVLKATARGALLCNDAALRAEGDDWVLNGDPTEGALLTLALKAGFERERERAVWPRVDVIPFESEHRFMATLHHDQAGRHLIFLKGAPERVLELCDQQRGAQADVPLQPDYWRAHMDEVASAGMRLLAIAVRDDAQLPQALSFDAIEQGGFVLLALLGLSDPPREEAIAAVERCATAGIRVKMVTGDHVATASAIGRQLGLCGEAPPLTGADIEELDEAGLRRVVRDTEIFARASPEHKLRLVQALQAEGEVVAMTGDGVNDAPALKRAEVGVAMGDKGTEAAKEAAEVVLTDDNFASIAAAVEEGRTAYDNLRKGLAFILPTNVGQGCIVLTAVLLGLTMPILPAQILWVNMITAVTLALTLAFEGPEQDIMLRPPRPPGEALLTPFVVWRVLFVGALLVSGGIGFFLWEVARGESLAVARTAAVNALVIGQVFYLFNIRNFRHSILNREGFFGNRYVLGGIAVLLLMQTLYNYAPFMQQLFGSVALDAATLLRVFAFGVFVLLIVELEKAVVRRLNLSF